MNLNTLLRKRELSNGTNQLDNYKIMKIFKNLFKSKEPDYCDYCERETNLFELKSYNKEDEFIVCWPCVKKVLDKNLK